MKVLTTVWNLLDYTGSELFISRNGGSIMIYNICEYIGRVEESFVFVGSRALSEMVYNHIHILDNRKYLPLDRNDITVWQNALQKCLKDVLQEIKPDFVFVQGGGAFSYNCFITCKRNMIPYAFVDHLYIGKKRNEYHDEETSRWEEMAFADNDLNVIAIGTSMYRAIIRDYPRLKNVSVIPNGTPYTGEMRDSDLIERYHLSGKKILLCSGTLHPRKNQIQLVRAFQLLPENYKKNITILFCGKDSIKKPTKNELLNAIRDAQLEDSLYYIGSFSMDEMKKIYSAVDGLIMPSLSEGLSLVALEMITYGKPIIMFSDNETAGDINDKNVVVQAFDHSDQSLADAIAEWYERKWDNHFIKNYSKYYNMERVADEYISYARKHINSYLGG